MCRKGENKVMKEKVTSDSQEESVPRRVVVCSEWEFVVFKKMTQKGEHFIVKTKQLL